MGLAAIKHALAENEQARDGCLGSEFDALSLREEHAEA
jgi:hypothetical protein